MKVITMTAYRRPAYTREVLAAMAKCDGIADWLLLPNVEPGNEEVIAAFRESFGRNRFRGVATGRPGRRARLAEIAKQRPPATIQVVARTGDRTQKGRRLWTPAFRITLR
jgi:hypothetical protein